MSGTHDREERKGDENYLLGHWDTANESFTHNC